MNIGKYIFLFVLLLVLPLKAFSDGYAGYIPWPVPEDTINVPAGVNLNEFWAQDTAGLKWQGANGTTAWQNKTRVYVLQAFQSYYWSAACTLLTADRKFCVRGQYGVNYAIPYVTGASWKPRIYLGPGSPQPGNFLVLNAANDTMVLKNVSISGYDEINQLSNMETIPGSMLEVGSTGSGSIYLDSVIINNGRGQFVRLAGTPKTCRVLNSIIADGGGMQNSNLGAGKFIDLRDSAIDTIDVQNSTIFNYMDRVVRHLNSLGSVKNFIFNHNTVLNCMSYHGFLVLGWVDTSGSGTFQIKNNLFVDNFALGPDTDYTRQGEMTDSPDLDPNNSLPLMSWIIAKTNTSPNITPWDISHNYYNISDSGWSIRNYATTLHPVLYGSGNPEPIMTSDIVRQVNANGGNATTAFQSTDIKFANAPLLMTKFCKWYFDDASDGYIPFLDPDSAYGAGAGKIKNTAKPVLHFIKCSANEPGPRKWAYDMKRMTADSMMTYLDLNYLAGINLANAASDGGPIGSKMWTCTGTAVQDQPMSPGRFALYQNYPNPFNPTTNFTYELAKAGKVSIKVYDILGREIATLVNEFKPAGSHPANWDASSFSTGVYFYKMQSGSFTATKKMILMK